MKTNERSIELTFTLIFVFCIIVVFVICENHYGIGTDTPENIATGLKQVASLFTGSLDYESTEPSDFNFYEILNNEISQNASYITWPFVNQPTAIKYNSVL